MTRREMLAALGGGALGSSVSIAGEGHTARPGVDAIERANGGRLGVFAFDTETGLILAWRADEPFAMQSTFKAPLAAMVLGQVQAGRDRLDATLPYGPADMLPFSPVTAEHVGTGRLSIGKLTAAILEHSDNTAANLLLAHVGGPAALTGYIRSLGDRVTSVRRGEVIGAPEAGGNTTTPRAFGGLMQTILLGNLLEPTLRLQLRNWMAANEPGRSRLRATFPSGWLGADRTGTSDGVCNDAAIAWPPHRAPVTIAAFYAAPRMDLEAQEAVIREVGRAVIKRIS